MLRIVNPANIGVLSCFVGDLHSLSVLVFFCICLLYCLFTSGTCMPMVLVECSTISVILEHICTVWHCMVLVFAIRMINMTVMIVTFKCALL